MSTATETTDRSFREELVHWFTHKPEKNSEFVIWGTVWLVGVIVVLSVTGVVVNAAIQLELFAAGLGPIKLAHILIVATLIITAAVHVKHGAPKSAYWIPGLVFAILVFITLFHGIPRIVWGWAEPESGLAYSISTGLRENPIWSFIIFLALGLFLVWLTYKLIGRKSISSFIKICAFVVVVVAVLWLMSMTPILEVATVILMVPLNFFVAGSLLLVVIGLALMPSIFQLDADKNEIRVDENGRRVYDSGERDDDGSVIWHYENGQPVVLSVQRRPRKLAVILLILFFLVMCVITGMTLEVTSG